MNKKFLLLIFLGGMLVCAGRLYAGQQLYGGKQWAPPKAFKGEVRPWAPPKGVEVPAKAWAPPRSFKGEVKPWAPPRKQKFEKGKPSLPDDTYNKYPRPGQPPAPPSIPGAAPVPPPTQPAPEEERDQGKLPGY